MNGPPLWLPYMNLRVDDSPAPLVEMRRILEIFLDANIRGTGSLAPDIGWRIASAGQSGLDIRDMQVMLRDLGHYAGPIDGFFGEKTAIAVRAFQAQAGLPVDGLMGPEACARLAEVYDALWR